jgi:hypothetical protein
MNWAVAKYRGESVGASPSVNALAPSIALLKPHGYESMQVSSNSNCRPTISVPPVAATWWTLREEMGG